MFNLFGKVFSKLQVPLLQRSLYQPTVQNFVWKKLYSNTPTNYEIVDDDNKIQKQIVANVNSIVKNNNYKIFAVVHICGKQFKVTEGDIIIIEGYWPPDTGDRLTLDKVLLAGGQDFTLVGKPIIQKGLVQVIATVIEKTLSHTKTHFKKKRRKQYMRTNFYKIPQTYLRINAVDMVEELDNPSETRGLETVIF